jgi:putative ABC transport system permease protein
MSTILHDLRYAVRTYRRNPALAATAIVVLALGIAATTATYSVLEAVILRSLPYRDADRIVAIEQITLKFRGSRRGGGTSSSASLDGARQAQASLEDVTAVIGSGQPILTGFGEPERINAWHAQANFFTFLGAQPIRGRIFTATEDQPGAPQIAIASYGFWTSRLAGDPEVIGRTLTLDGTPVEIVGVMGPEFQLPAKAALWRPMGTFAARASPVQSPQGGYWIFARLRPGVTIASAHAELDQIYQRIAATHPNFKDWGATLTPLHETLAGTARRPLILVFSAAALVLLVACANVANLLLARAMVRKQEIATRLAIGATRGRLVRQLLTESLLLAVIAGAIGIAAASAAIPMLISLGSTEVPQFRNIGVNGRVLAVAMTAAIGTVALFGLAPALLAIGRSHRIGGGTTRWKSRTGDLFLITQVALTMVLLAGAGLLADTFVRLMKVDMGFSTGNVVAAQLTLPTRRYASPESIVGFADRTLERLRAQPHVAVAAIATGMPMLRGIIGSVDVEGRPARQGAPWAGISAVTADYFRLLGIPLKRGRLLAFDGQTDRASILVDDMLVREYFGKEDPIGQRLTFNGTTAVIVGVVGNSRDDLSKEPNPHIYQPLTAAPYRFLKVLVRADVAPRQVAPAMRTTLQEIDPLLPVDKLATMETIMSDSVARQRFLAVLLLLFGAVTLAIASAGIYGLVSYTVRRRLQEIGIRIALGAGRRQILRLIAGRGVGLAAIGLLLGTAGAVAATKTMESVLFGAGARNFLVLGGAGLTLAAVAVLASYIPARDAAGVNPVTLLRTE